MPKISNVPEIAIYSADPYMMFYIAILLIIYGIYVLLFPQTIFTKFFGTKNTNKRGALTSVRLVMGLLPLLLGASYILLGDQPIIAVVLTVAIGIIIFMRLLSMLVRRSFGWLNAILLVVEIILMVLAVMYLSNAFIPS